MTRPRRSTSSNQWTWPAWPTRGCAPNSHDDTANVARVFGDLPPAKSPDRPQLTDHSWLHPRCVDSSEFCVHVTFKPGKVLGSRAGPRRISPLSATCPEGRRQASSVEYSPNPGCTPHRSPRPHQSRGHAPWNSSYRNSRNSAPGRSVLTLGRTISLWL